MVMLREPIPARGAYESGHGVIADLLTCRLEGRACLRVISMSALMHL
jgi:hypothetical protein